MNKLISLEVKRNRLRPYHIAVLIGGFTLLAFHYFMAAIPLIDPIVSHVRWSAHKGNKLSVTKNTLPITIPHSSMATTG